ncbi:protealysin inhibitor emfourin [Granulicella arctica]|uniref:protealysin inhibitor emfourin n=1 Tax=Granulicella arctica TaxID=940613 RepID=UPI0021E053CA|nr:protealysin inhibitor emfourin [Granulicella arctica]
MEISFTRTGGFVGRATNVSGVIHTDAHGVHVSAPGSDYRRDLAVAEAKQVEDLVTRVPGQGSNQPGHSPVRDGFQYDVSVTMEDGETHSIPPSAQTQGLSDWVQRETQRIWEHRLASVPK